MEFGLWESPELPGECGRDNDCAVKNCFLCVLSTFEPREDGICDDRDDTPIDGASCGCVENKCAWYD